MKFLFGDKDGGKESRVWAYGFEWKRAFSIILLRFEDGSREAYHTHAFNCWNWVVRGAGLVEHLLVHLHTPDWQRGRSRFIWRRWRPWVVRRETFHQVRGIGRTWVLTIRGPWRNQWREHANGCTYTLTHGRQLVG